jgi:outer membrane protein TolC
MEKKHKRFKKEMTLGVILLFFSLPWLTADEPLTLEKAVQLALSRNERSLAGTDQLAVAEADVAKARSYFFPQLTGSGTYTRRPFEVSRTIGGTNIVVQSLNALAGTISLNMILFDSQTIPGYNQTRAENSAQRFSVADARRRLAFEVATSFLMTLGQEQAAEAAKHRLELAGKNLEAARARYHAGLVSVNDVTRTELEYASAEQVLTQMIGDRDIAILQLGHLLVSEIRSGLSVPDWLLRAAELIPPTVSDLLPQAEKRRPDLQALQFQARALHFSMAQATLKWLPSLNLVGSWRITNEAGLTGRATNYSMGLSVNWALFDGFNRNADYRQRRSLAHLADLDVQAAKRTSRLELENALISLTSQQASIRQAKVALDAANKNARETAELYRQGLSTALQVADANVRLFEAEVALVNVRFGLGVALLNLRAAEGKDPFGQEVSVK